MDEDRAALRHLEQVLGRAGHTVTTTTSGSNALDLLERVSFDVVLTDLHLRKMAGLHVLQRCRVLAPDSEVVMVGRHADLGGAIAAVKAGAFDFLVKPCPPDTLCAVVAEAVTQVRRRRGDPASQALLAGFQGRVRIITRNPHMQRLLDMARQIGPTGCNVLITGESGTGKELFARYLHEHGGRPDGPFVAVNCGAFNEELLANELFGNEKGAFTGAIGKPGLIETANGGTLFLDEVTEMSTAMQVKLLRVIQEREVLRLGGTEPVKVDVRVCSATNRDVPDLVRHGRFRQDLYFRLNVVNLHIPPLSDRRDDIPLLAQHFLAKCTAVMRKETRSIDPQVVELLRHYDFPGNVRELENIIERAVALCAGSEIRAAQLPDDLCALSLRTFRKADGRLATLAEHERDYIDWVLRETNGNQTRAARILDIDRVSLWRKLKRLHPETRGIDNARSTPSPAAQQADGPEASP